MLIAVILVVLAFVTAPLRVEAGVADGEDEDPRFADLEARKQAKYREIRDAELDREAGKITEQEWRRQDAELRREAIGILKQLDEPRGRQAHAVRRPNAAPWPTLPGPMETLLGVVQVIISVVLIFLVLLHSGKDTGLSGAFGIGQTGSAFGGGSLVERNLDRWTIFFAILFAVNTLVMLKI